MDVPKDWPQRRVLLVASLEYGMMRAMWSPRSALDVCAVLLDSTRATQVLT